MEGVDVGVVLEVVGSVRPAQVCRLGQVALAHQVLDDLRADAVVHGLQVFDSGLPSASNSKERSRRQRVRTPGESSRRAFWVFAAAWVAPWYLSRALHQPGVTP